MSDIFYRSWKCRPSHFEANFNSLDLVGKFNRNILGQYRRKILSVHSYIPCIEKKIYAPVLTVTQTLLVLQEPEESAVSTAP